MSKSTELKTLAIVCGLAALFIATAFLAHAYQGDLTAAVRAGGPGGPVAFILLTALLLIFLIPFDISVLIPLATGAWGPLATALMTLVGWTLGSAVAFYVSRRYGTEVARQIIGARRLSQAERAVPKQHLFWWVLFLQACTTVDLISYVFGLFTDIGVGSYVLATGIGNILPAFFFAYAGVLPVWYEAGAVIAVLIIVALFFLRYYRRHPSR